MLRIGDFARLAGVPVRALRHYEAERLLLPAHVDESTGYRSYRFEQLAALDRVLALRDLGFSLADVRGLLASDADVRALAERLRQQRVRLAAEVERQTSRLRRLEALQRAIGAEPKAPELRGRGGAHARVRALARRAGGAGGRGARGRAGGGAITALCEEAEARAGRDRADRSPFLLFHAPLDVEACVPVRASCRAAAVRVVPGAPLAGSITYSGAYTQTRSL